MKAECVPLFSPPKSHAIEVSRNRGKERVFYRQGQRGPTAGESRYSWKMADTRQAIPTVGLPALAMLSEENR
jgi:hypothetical protein